MTTTFKYNGANRSLIELTGFVEKDKWLLPQMLLALSTNSTLNRIVCCPTFPAKVFTRDLQDMLQLFHKTTPNPFEISSTLSFLFEHATELKYRKNHGQYFTPQKVAIETINRLALKNGQNILEPGTGTGIFPTMILKLILKLLTPCIILAWKMIPFLLSLPLYPLTGLRLHVHGKFFIAIS